MDTNLSLQPIAHGEGDVQLVGLIQNLIQQQSFCVSILVPRLQKQHGQTTALTADKPQDLSTQIDRG